MSLVHLWSAFNLLSAGSHGILQLDVCVSVQFWSGRFSSPEQFGVVVFKHSLTLPTLILFFILHSTGIISVDGCLEWRLMAGSRGFASHGGCILSLGAGWTQWKPLDTPGTHLPFKRGSG